MAFFNFRADRDTSEPSIRSARSVEAMRQRAKHRLIGSALLIGVGVLGFPFLFDTQPRAVAPDVRIDMPDKTKVAPLQIPLAAGPQATQTAVTKAHVTGPSAVEPVVTSTVATPKSSDEKITAKASLDAKEQLVAVDAAKPPTPKVQPAKAPTPPAVKPKSDIKPNIKPDDKSDSKTANEAVRAKALLEGKEPKGDIRYIIQVGAFATDEQAQTVRWKLERAGLKTYIHVAQTKDGPLTRVRLGPFTHKAEVDKTATKVKALSIPVSVLTL